MAGNFASGYWEPGHGNIGPFVRDMARSLECCVGPGAIHWEHTKKHCEQPWNEMADRIADVFMRGEDFSIPVPDPGWHFCIKHLRMEWAQLVPMSCCSDAFPPNPAGQLFWQENECPPQPVPVHRLIPTTEDITGKQFSVSVHAVSANVQTCIGKCKFLEQLLKERDVGIFCVQEARCRAGLTRSGDFWRYASDGKNHWGAEVWVVCEHNFARIDGKPVVIDDSCIHVVSFGPRRMRIGIDMAGHTLHVASVHFPQRNRSAEEKCECLQTISSILDEARGHTCIIGMDANGRVCLRFEGVTCDLHED